MITGMIGCMLTGCTKQSKTQQMSDLCEGITFVDERMERGVKQAAALWREEDGTREEFQAFVQENYARTEAERQALFESLSRILEKLNESADLLTVELLRPTQLTNAGEPTTVDWIMSGYSTSAHWADDLFANKVAFITILNFPFYSLEEKNTLGVNWTRQQWAEARLGDVFTARVPAEVQANMAQALANAENYIADYNIYMGNLRTQDGEQLWPNDKVLLSHWNLRDELKALYQSDNLESRGKNREKQEMIYQVMQRIVNQTIPAEAVNNPDYIWNPYGDVAEGQREPYTRYQKILDIFHAMQALDAYCPNMPTGIQRNFEGGMEFSAAELDSLFRTLIGSEQVQQVAALIRERLERNLRPYDIWYDGFKARATMNEDALSTVTRSLYPDADAFAKDMPRLMQQLGFTADEAKAITQHIVVEPARGSGHAWPCLGRNEPARLRTRIPASGMDYKGYNIAVHEFGHCVEQVLDMYQIDHYMLSGVPNTAYTEASAFLWQQRDLQLLPQSSIVNRPIVNRDGEDILDAFWSMYEIMGVSLVDMQMWQWLYANPKATAKELCEETMRIAREVWIQYYEPVLGEHDCILLGIYSHMVNCPMYLPNYPLGHIVQFQLEEHLAQYKTKREFATEYARIYRLGRLTPQEWIRQAVQSDLSVEPVLRKINR